MTVSLCWSSLFLLTKRFRIFCIYRPNTVRHRWVIHSNGTTFEGSQNDWEMPCIQFNEVSVMRSDRVLFLCVCVVMNAFESTRRSLPRSSQWKSKLLQFDWKSFFVNAFEFLFWADWYKETLRQLRKVWISNMLSPNHVEPMKKCLYPESPSKLSHSFSENGSSTMVESRNFLPIWMFQALSGGFKLIESILRTEKAFMAWVTYFVVKNFDEFSHWKIVCFVNARAKSHCCSFCIIHILMCFIHTLLCLNLHYTINWSLCYSIFVPML